MIDADRSETSSPHATPTPPMVADIDDDIPEALRELPANLATPSPNWLKIGIIAGGSGALLALIAGMIVSLSIRSTASSQGGAESPVASPPNSSTVNSSPASASAGSPIPDGSLLGHYPYQEAPPEELEAIVPDGSIKLRRAAAAKYRAMAEAAAAEGVILVPISGFRSLEDQRHLFFDIKAERGQNASKRAEVSAPPGYSEHHTGYAVDIGDGNAPSTNLNVSFESTAAFQWLQRNASYYSFELSFPPNNPQGISYEPWHWRFVGDINSLETFYKARSPKQ
ncbi:MAG: D-alanyl-D-alanine carboxypeptidase family protein [Cyanobacteria bacterium]|nr:D-alanyl-D-alanine carboxypeptidase family protein [Cyanobacteriota bacterium]MDW8203250.1 D-alanyl-D-alanine carboxypeptidase family protein [Cyanobacteriota bacterium SKYGB_h_bin112]